MGLFRFLNALLQIWWDLRHWRFFLCSFAGIACVIGVVMDLPDSKFRAVLIGAVCALFFILGLIWDGNARRN